MAEPLAEAFVRVRPETSGFKDELRAGIQKSGAGTEGDKQGEEFGGRFSTTAKKRIEAALKALPNVKVNADSTDAELKVAALRAELKGLSDEHIGITIDEHLATAQLVRIRAELDALGAGSRSASFKVDAQSAVRELSQIEGVAKKATAAVVTDFGKAGSQSVSGFVDALVTAWPATLAVAAPLALELTAALGGGLLAGAGGGAIATGIALQLQSPQVHGAVSDLGSTLKSELTSATDVFAKPLEAGVADLKASLGPVIDDLRPAFKELAPYVEVFGRELGNAAKVAGPLFGSALKDAGPVLGVIAHEIPTVAKGFGDFFAQIGHGAKGGAEALDALIKGASMGLSALGYVIRGAENAWDFFIQTMDKATGVAAYLAAPIPGLGSKFRDLHDYVHGTATAFDNAKISGAEFSDTLGGGGLTGTALGAAGALNQLDKATLQWKNDTLDARDAGLSFKDSLANLKDQLKQNKAGFNENTADGRKNVEALNQLAHSAQDVADKTYASTGSSQAAAAAYKQARDQVLQLAIQGHASKDEIDALNTALDSAIKIRKGSVDIEVNLTGSGKALVTQGSGAGATTLLGGKGVKLRASGGDLAPGDVSWVGEKGPELISVGQGGAHVTSNADLRGLTAFAGRSPAPAVAPAPVINLTARVFVGDTELRDVIRVEIDDYDQATAAAVAGGPRR